MSTGQPKLFPAMLLISFVLAGCGSGSNPAPAPNPVFSSSPVMTADEGTLYSYRLTATSPDGATVTFTVTSGPTGASLSGDTLSWTPTHEQSRSANTFTVTASTPGGGSAAQSWNVTPDGTIQIKAVATYWTSTGRVDVPRVWLAGQAYPAVLVPQTDGSLSRLQGSGNPDGTFGIPDVPAGFYWLQLSPTATYWTSTSTFDAGFDVAGSPLKLTAPNPTTLNLTLIGLDPAQNDLISLQSDMRGFEWGIIGFQPAPNPWSLTVSLRPDIDYSKVNTLFFSQMEQVNSGAFHGLALGPASTISNVSITNGAANSITATFTPSPKSSIPLNITGSAWANNYQNIAPATVVPLLTDFSVSAQPFVTDRIAERFGSFIGPDLTMLVPRGSTIGVPPVTPYYCGLTSSPFPVGLGNAFLPVILTDQDFGTISYGDPYPVAWPRLFQICQHAAVQIPRPNSTLTDTFRLTFGQTTAIPSAPIAPLVGPVQNPLINGNSFFQSASLNTSAVNLSWTAPAGVLPFGYYVTVYQLATLPSGATQYVTVGRFGTSKTSMSVPLLTSASTYVFQITAAVDGLANIETSPNRSQLPIAHSTIISAPIIVN